MSDPLFGKIALVTGGGGGLGKAIARSLLEAGAKVVIVDIHGPRLGSCCEELSHLGEVQPIIADITKPADVHTTFETVLRTCGGLSILVNNAGLADTFDPVGTLPLDLWNTIMAVNLTAPYLCSQAAVRIFLSNAEVGGVILNIGSQAGARGFCAGAAYTSSKHGLVGLTKNTAAFYGRQNIRCNIIMPGPAETNIRDNFINGYNTAGHELALKMTDMSFKLKTEELYRIGELAVFLCSTRSSVINGAAIAVDGGATVA